MAILSLIEWIDQTGREMVKRVPERGSGQFRLGSQLVVRESQTALFFRDGKAYDVFAPGRHTLSTQNLPLIDRIFGLPFGGRSPFRSEVYFVNMKQFTDMKWGTPQPVTLRDADFGMIRLRAFGAYSMQIYDPSLFINTIVGTKSLYEKREIERYLRSVIVSRLTDIIGTVNIPFLDLASHFDEIGVAGKVRLRDDFAALGIELRGFYVENISPTEETQKAIDERSSMGAIGDMQSYLQYKAARAMGDAAQNPGNAGSMAGAGFGLGAGAGMGAMMAQILGQSMQQTQQAPPPQPAAPPAYGGASRAMPEAAPASAGGGTVENEFANLEQLVKSQIAIPRAQRNRIVQTLGALKNELAKPDTDLMTIKMMRKQIETEWSWLAESVGELFHQPAIEAEMAEATRRFLAG